MNQIEENNQELLKLLEIWTPKLQMLPIENLLEVRNSQKRNIKQIVGHMVDSASNNTHRMVHLQYQNSPLEFSNYAANGNNDRWIAIQDYENENWTDLIQLWKASHKHFVHVSKNIDPLKLKNQWNSGNVMVSLENMVLDFLRHFKLHLSEIDELIQQSK